MIERSEVGRRVIAVIAETQQIDEAKIRPESTFEELGIDSFDGVNILFGIESEFDIHVPDEAAKTLRGVDDVIQGVIDLLGKEPASGERD